ncbi:hypothetical protein GWA97_13660 [Flavobacterium sp. LaA7.5]|nr:hypothetical protein [Flavobacterium salilacus subsp. altitudinum]
MKIWIYDNQLGYFDLLKNNMPKDYQLKHFSVNNCDEEDSEDKADSLIFFLNDELELIDYMKLQRLGMKTILCSPTKGGAILEKEVDFIHIDINLNKEDLVRSILRLVTAETSKAEGI